MRSNLTQNIAPYRTNYGDPQTSSCVGGVNIRVEVRSLHEIGSSPLYNLCKRQESPQTASSPAYVADLNTSR
jgi:hypothetical protein